ISCTTGCGSTVSNDQRCSIRPCFEHERNVDVAAYRLAVRADVMCPLHDFHRGIVIQTGNCNHKLHGKAIIAALTRPDRDTSGDGRSPGINGEAPARFNNATLETGAVANGEQL